MCFLYISKLSEHEDYFLYTENPLIPSNSSDITSKYLILHILDLHIKGAKHFVLFCVPTIAQYNVFLR